MHIRSHTPTAEPVSCLLAMLYAWLVAEQGRPAAGLAATTAQMVALAWVPSIPASLAIMAAGALGNVAFPAISAIQSGLVPETEQARQPGHGTLVLPYATVPADWGVPPSPLPHSPAAPRDRAGASALPPRP